MLRGFARIIGSREATIVSRGGLWVRPLFVQSKQIGAELLGPIRHRVKFAPSQAFIELRRDCRRKTRKKSRSELAASRSTHRRSLRRDAWPVFEAVIARRCATKDWVGRLAFRSCGVRARSGASPARSRGRGPGRSVRYFLFGLKGKLNGPFWMKLARRIFRRGPFRNPGSEGGDRAPGRLKNPCPARSQTPGPAQRRSRVDWSIGRKGPSVEVCEYMITSSPFSGDCSPNTAKSKSRALSPSTSLFGQRTGRGLSHGLRSAGRPASVVKPLIRGGAVVCRARGLILFFRLFVFFFFFFVFFCFLSYFSVLVSFFYISWST